MSALFGWLLFYVTQFSIIRCTRFNNLYTLCLQKKIGISNKFYGVRLWMVLINPILGKSSNCIGHIVYKNNTRQRLVSLFKLPSKLFIIFVFVWNSLWHVVMIKEGVDRMKEYSSRMLWHSITNLKLMIISFEFLLDYFSKNRRNTNTKPYLIRKSYSSKTFNFPIYAKIYQICICGGGI